MALHNISAINSAIAYPDEYLIEEDQMGDSKPQDKLLSYLMQVLEWFYHDDGWMVAHNLNFYHPLIQNSENLIVPDIAVFKDIAIAASEQATMNSWDMMLGDKSCAPFVFESSSKSTYANDILEDRKLKLYGLIGVREYFAYDPNTPRVWPKRLPERLLGWKYDVSGQPYKIKADGQGRLWSEVLESYLVADGPFLRILDRNGNVRLTKAEAETQRADAEMRQREAEARRADAERKQREAETQRAEAEAQRADAEKKRADELQRLLDELRRNQQGNN